MGSVPFISEEAFLFIGRFVPKKGIRILLKAYEKVSPDPQLVASDLVGDGSLRTEVETLIAKNHISGVNVTGFITENERHRLTKEAKWMVTPPHTKEDLGLTPLEARSVGVPCIATLDGGVQETAGKYALFAKPGCVESLAKQIKKAIGMNDAEYEGKALLTKEGLRDYVRPLDQYSEKLFTTFKKELKANERLELIDQLRGLSCLGVLLYHVRIDLWIGMVADHKLSSRVLHFF